MKQLIVGCGLKPVAGAVNLDKEPLPGVDVCFDLEAIGCVGSKGFTDWISSRANPYYHDYQSKWVGLVPFLDGYFDKVIAEDVVEHLDNPVAVVQELGRVLKVGGTLWVRGPDADWVWHDITHKRAFTERTFDGFCPETYDGKHYGHYHGPVKFRMVEKRHFNHGWEYTLEKL